MLQFFSMLDDNLLVISCFFIFLLLHLFVFFSSLVSYELGIEDRLCNEFWIFLFVRCHEMP